MLWSGDHLFEGTVETIELLKSKGVFSVSFIECMDMGCQFTQGISGKQVVFVTNNSTKSRADYKKKLDAMGIPAEVVSHVHLSPSPPSFLPLIARSLASPPPSSPLP